METKYIKDGKEIDTNWKTVSLEPDENIDCLDGSCGVCMFCLEEQYTPEEDLREYISDRYHDWDTGGY